MYRTRIAPWVVLSVSLLSLSSATEVGAQSLRVRPPLLELTATVQGGVFRGASNQFTIEQVGDVPVDWTIVASSWLTVSSKAGRGSAVITVAALPLAAAPGLPDAEIFISAPSATPSSIVLRVRITISRSPLTGTQKWATLLCRFADSATVTPYPFSSYQHLAGAAFGSLDHYFREVSYDQFALTGSVVLGWYTLPKPRSSYVFRVSSGGFGGEDHDLDAIAADCAAAADAAVYFPDYSGINFVLNGQLAGGVHLATTRQSVTIDGATRSYRATFLSHANNGHWLYAHEMGHAFGLRHASGPYSNTYDSHWTPMSGCCGSLFDPVSFVTYAMHYLAYQKLALGWIPEDRKYTAGSNSSAVVRLSRLAKPLDSGYLIAVVPLSATRYYTVELRSLEGYDAGLPGQGVIIHDVDTMRGDREAHVIDADGNGDPNDGGAIWLPGETFVDPTGAIRIAVEALANGAANVRITTGATGYCTYQVRPSSLNLPRAGGTVSLAVEASTGCTWSAASQSPFITVDSGASGTASGTVRLRVAAASGDRVGAVLVAGQVLNVVQSSLPLLSLSPERLTAAVVRQSGGTTQFATSSQVLLLSQAGSGTVPWTVVVDQPWLAVSPTQGTGPAILTVRVTDATRLPSITGSLSASIRIVTSDAANTASAQVIVWMRPSAATSAPVGSFDTPIDGSTVSGSIPVTGWSLDDIEVKEVQIWRQPHPLDPPGAAFSGPAPQGGKVFVGYAAFVEGARPDVALVYPSAPRSSRAGWGYMMLTRGLIWDGRGPFSLYAIAADAEGQLVELGSKTVTVDNAGSIKPFGSIDAPEQGATASGVYPNTGWVLSPSPGATIPAGNVVVAVDGVLLAGVPSVSDRADITARFTDLNTAGAGRGLFIDTTKYAPGIHTIQWLVTDSLGNADGVGSRVFTIANAGASVASRTPPLLASMLRADGPVVGAGDRRRPGSPVGRRGWNPTTAFAPLTPGADGALSMDAEELDRLEIHLPLQPGWQWRGESRVGTSAGTLPIGSHLDPDTGIFTWQPPAAFLGTHDVVFVAQDGLTVIEQPLIRIRIHPKGTTRTPER